MFYLCPFLTHEHNCIRYRKACIPTCRMACRTESNVEDFFNWWCFLRTPEECDLQWRQSKPHKLYPESIHDAWGRPAVACVCHSIVFLLLLGRWKREHTITQCICSCCVSFCQNETRRSLRKPSDGNSGCVNVWSPRAQHGQVAVNFLKRKCLTSNKCHASSNKCLTSNNVC